MSTTDNTQLVVSFYEQPMGGLVARLEVEGAIRCPQAARQKNRGRSASSGEGCATSAQPASRRTEDAPIRRADRPHHEGR